MVVVDVLVYDTSMKLLALIDSYDYFSWTRNWYTPDVWTMKINRYMAGVDNIAIGRYIGYRRGSVLRIGIIESLELPLDNTGKSSEQWNISGLGAEGILGQRIAMHNTNSGTGYDVQSAAGETAMRWYVNKNCIAPTDANRIIPGLTLASGDSARGGAVDYSARFQNLIDLLNDLCRFTGLSYKLVWGGINATFVFTIYQGTDRSATVKLSTEFGNIDTYNYLDSDLQMKNFIYVGGQGTAAARTVQPVYNGAEPTLLNRREVFVDAVDCLNVAQLTDRGQECLVDLGEETSLEVNYFESGSFLYGTDFDLGDTITVDYPQIVTVASRIISTTEEHAPEGAEKITLILGKEYPDLKFILKERRKMFDTQSRR